MDINWYISVEKMFETARMVNVQVPEYNSFHILDIITGRFDRSGKFVLLVVLGSRKDVGAFWTTLLDEPSTVDISRRNKSTYSVKLFCAPCFKENTAKARILNQGCKTYQIPQLVLGIWVASSGSICSS